MLEEEAGEGGARARADEPISRVITVAKGVNELQLNQIPSSMVIFWVKVTWKTAPDERRGRQGSQRSLVP